MGSKITRLTPMRSFAAETGGTITLFLATDFGPPRFDHPDHHRRHRGVGATRLGGAIVWAWVITPPAATAMGPLFFWLTRLFS